MKIKKYLWVIIFIAIILISAVPVHSQQRFPSHTGFQVSTYGALSLGIYEGAATLAELKQHGDFGLGTYEGLDGEMVGIDGKFYQIKADGIAYPVADTLTTPFSAVTFFQKERSLRLTGRLTYAEVQQNVDQQLPTQNLPYAIRIQGTFPYLKVRSVPKQSLPYSPLGTVVSQQQKIFELRNVRGTLVGFRIPSYFKSVNVGGYHFHFITSDRRAGGHVLDGEFLNPVADVDMLHDWQMKLPEHTAFEQASLE